MSVAPPFRWTTRDQSRAWRLVAAIADGDEHLLNSIIAEAIEPGAVDRLITALAATLTAMLKSTMSDAAFDTVIVDRLAAAIQ